MLRAMLRCPPVLACLRLALMVMLLVGVCLQPVLVLACEVEDARAALDGGAGTEAPSQPGEPGDCCDNPACGDCCMHAPATVAEPARSLPFFPQRAGPAPVHCAVISAHYPVDSRPPIDA